MSSRNHLIGSIIPITILIVFSPCCWSLWLSSPVEDVDPHMYNNLQLDNEYLIGNRPLEQEVPYLPKLYQQQHNSDQRPDGSWTQVMAFLQKTVEDQKIHTISSNLNKLLRENSDEYLPIVYEAANESPGTSPADDYDNAPEVVEHQGEENEDDDEVNKIDPSQPDEDEQVVEYEINDKGEVQLQKDKRAGRYYRRYPWKRRNNRYYENPKYNCKPSREEVVKLLIALHHYQSGNKDRRMVKFCKRDRPLGNIITNIRFLG